MSVINRNSASPIYEIFADAVAANMRVGQICIIKGQTTATDGLGGQYEVKANGSGGTAMNNGNELVLLTDHCVKGDQPDEIPTNEIADSLRVKKVASLVDLPLATGSGNTVHVNGYYAGSTKGGDQFVDIGPARHNGGTLIDPSRKAEIGTSAYYVDIGVDVNCFERITDAPTLLDFGAQPDSTDISAAFDAFRDSGQTNFNLLGESWNFSGDLAINSTKNCTLYKGTLKSIDGNGQVRFQNAAHALSLATIDGTNQANYIGLNIESTCIGAKVINSRIINTTRSGIYDQGIGTDIEGSYFFNCGLGGSGNFRSTIYAIGDNTRVSRNWITDANWGIYFRKELQPADSGVGCSAVNNIVRASVSADVDSQGISAQNQEGLIIEANNIRDFQDNGIDNQQCTRSKIHNNYVTNCKDGMFIGDRSASGYQVTNNTFRSCVRGVRLVNGTGFENQTFRNLNISDNTIISCTDGAILASVTAAGSNADTITINNNTIESTGAGTYGIKANNLDNSSISGNKFYRQPGHNIEVTASDMVSVFDNVFTDPSFGGGGFSAVDVNGSSFRIMIKNNYAIGSATTAYNIVDGASHTISGNRWRSIATGVATGTATSVTQSDNIAV